MIFTRFSTDIFSRRYPLRRRAKDFNVRAREGNCGFYSFVNKLIIPTKTNQLPPSLLNGYVFYFSLLPHMFSSLLLQMLILRFFIIGIRSWKKTSTNLIVKSGKKQTCLAFILLVVTVTCYRREQWLLYVFYLFNVSSCLCFVCHKVL